MRRKLCACGCGKKFSFTICQSRSEKRKFLPGHNSRGRKRPQEEKDRISQTMKSIMTDEIREQRRKSGLGRKHSITTKLKLSKLAKIREQKKKEQGFVVSQETRDKLSKKLKGKRNPPEVS